MGLRSTPDTIRLTNATTGGPVFVDVRDGRIVRITPIEFNSTDAPSWRIEARGRTFQPPRKVTLSPFTVGHRSTIYSPKRILTPLKRTDFNPNGNRNCDRRGESGYEPISWEKALDIVTEEITRAKRETGHAAIAGNAPSHHLWGNIGYYFSAYYRFMNLVGFSYAEHDPDSWEGWHWGGTHMWGNSHRLGLPEQYDLLEDALKHTEMIVFWSSDPESTSGIYAAYESTSRRRWLKDLGVKMVFIDPFFNHTAGLYSDKWFSPRLGTDVALGLAIAFTWLAEGTYDKEYVADRTLSFDEWKAYVLGNSDGQPKTPEWAEKETGIPAREIRALAREWAAKRTMLAAGGIGGWGGACRASWGNEWARTMIALAAMQGMGKPGRNIWSTTQGTPVDCSFMFPGYSEGGISGDVDNSAAGYRFVYRMFPRGGASRSAHRSAEGQFFPRLRFAEAVLDRKVEWRGRGLAGSSIESQFHKYEYPAPGYAPFEMYWQYGGSYLGTTMQANRHAKAFRSSNLRFVVNQSIWLEGETKFADIILPACTNFERWDISEFANCSGYIADSYIQCNHRVITLQQKCIEPLGQSKSDYDIFCEVTKCLGLYDLYSMGGKTDLDWVKDCYLATDLPEVISWEDFAERGYYVVPPPTDRKPTPALRWFAEGRERDTPDWGPPPDDTLRLKGLQTASGKIEFVSTSLSRLGDVDPERPALGPQYLPFWEGASESAYAEKYPLQMVSPHPRFSFHTSGDCKGSWMNEIKDHRILKEDGHYYWIMRLNPEDASDRGIRDGDLIRAFNDRGAVILAAQITERIQPGTVHSYESCADYQPLGEPGESPDRAGCVNLLTSSRFLTPTSTAMAPNSCRVEVEKWG